MANCYTRSELLQRCALVGLIGLLAIETPAQAFQLITSAEAALPPGTIPPFEIRGNPLRRPIIVVLSPSPNAGLVQSPLELKLRFQSFGGVDIDPDSVVITYLKQPNVNITQRIKPYITTAGIDLAQAEVPPGLHHFWIKLNDKNGLPAVAEFSFQVTK
jgi:hypothetical protein